MKKVICYAGCFLLTLLVFSNCNKQNHTQVLKGPYLGQNSPRNSPEIFAPGFISTGLREGQSTFMPGEYYYSTFIDAGKGMIAVILMTRIENGKWAAPDVASFSGTYMDYCPAIHPDGSRFYFLSDRLIGDNQFPDKMNIWIMDRTANGWSEPRPIGAPINGKGNLAGPSVTQDGTMYFTRVVDNWEGIFRAKYVNGRYQDAERLPDIVNSTNAQFHSYIAPDESYLILSVYGRDDTKGSTDYYVSFRDEYDNWSKVINLGDKINTKKIESSPSITADGKYFFYAGYSKPVNNYVKPLTLSEMQKVYNG